MLNIQIGPNDIVLTPLRDHPFMEQPAFYAFKFSSSDTGVERLCMVEDLSLSPKSYQRFAITGSTTTHDPEQSTVKLTPYGMWLFSLWPATGGTVNDIVTSGSPLCMGLCTLSE